MEQPRPVAASNPLLEVWRFESGVSSRALNLIVYFASFQIGRSPTSLTT